MLKMMGIVLLCVAVSLIGVVYCIKLKSRIKYLELLLKFSNQFSDEIRYHKERPLVNELNFNDLSDDVKEGWLPENDVNTKYIKQNNTNKNTKIY